MTFATKFAGKSAIVTGAGSGIGEAIANELAACGAHVMVQDLRQDAAEAVAVAIRGSGGSAAARGGDVSVQRDVVAIVDDLLSTHGRVDILVNNAGVQFVSPIDEFPLQQWDRLLGILLTGPFLLTQAVLPSMRGQHWGRIVNIASINGKRGEIGKAAYCSAKHGLIGLTRVSALETATDGITVNAICPGAVDTPLIRNQVADLAKVNDLPPDEVLEQIFFAHIPQRRFVEPSEIAAMASFLCSDDARGITGQSINVSAGLLMH